MNKPWELPVSLRVGPKCWPIRSDFASGLDCMVVLEADDLDDFEKADFVCRIIFPDWEEIYQAGYFEEAVSAAYSFLNGNRPQKTDKDADSDAPKGRLMSWAEDAAMIFAAINKRRPVDVRVEKPHWWTFLDYYMEIGESLFSTVLSLRQKLRDGKKLDKYEKEYIQANPQYFQTGNDDMHMDDADELLKMFE